MSNIINKLKQLVESSQLTEQQLEEFCEQKINQITWERKNIFKNEFDKVIQEQVHQQVENFIPPDKIYPVIEKIMQDSLDKIVNEKLRSKINSIVNKNITEDLEEIIKEVLIDKISRLTVVDEDELYRLQNNQIED